jgi:hypothetical protein
MKKLLSNLLHSAQSSTIDDLLALIKIKRGDNESIEQYQEMLRNYMIELKRQIDQCDGSCGLVEKINKD